LRTHRASSEFSPGLLFGRNRLRRDLCGRLQRRRATCPAQILDKRIGRERSVVSQSNPAVVVNRARHSHDRRRDTSIARQECRDERRKQHRTHGAFVNVKAGDDIAGTFALVVASRQQSLFDVTIPRSQSCRDSEIAAFARAVPTINPRAAQCRPALRTRSADSAGRRNRLRDRPPWTTPSSKQSVFAFGKIREVEKRPPPRSTMTFGREADPIGKASNTRAHKNRQSPGQRAAAQLYEF